METLDALVGRRVALRHRVGERDGRPLYTDAVGELADGDGDEVVVRTRRGPVRVRRDAVVAVRAVPPPVPRRPSWAAVERLEALCAAARGTAVRPRVPVGSPAEEALRRQGLVTGDEEVAVLVADLADLADLSRRLPATGGSGGGENPRRVARAVVEDHVIFVEAADGASLAEAVPDATRHGARWAVTEVSADDPAALAAWQQLGFVSHHRVRYLPAGAAVTTSTPPWPPA